MLIVSVCSEVQPVYSDRNITKWYARNRTSMYTKGIGSLRGLRFLQSGVSVLVP